jgi:hypothetical protein
MNKDTILSLLRHAMTFGGGFLVAKGAISDTTLAQVIPAVVAVVGALWGATDEYLASKKAKPATPANS